MKEPVYIVDAIRTPIGSPFRSLKDCSAVELAACVINGLVKRNGKVTGSIDEVIAGNVVSAGTGQNLARQAALLAGLKDETRAYVVNLVCGSGLQSVILGGQSIRAGNASLILALGTESATHSPHLLRREDLEEDGEKTFIDSLVFDGLVCQMTDKHMGELAENLAQKYKITRKRQDEYSLYSHQKASRAIQQGEMARELLPVHLKGNKTLSRDDRPRKNLTLAKLAELPSAFKKTGTISAGNSSAPCDGAAGVLLASGKAVKRLGLKPLAKIIAATSLAVDPALTFGAVVPAVKKCLKTSGIAFGSIGLFEIAESFGAQMIYTKKLLNIPDSKLNILGGDIAFGHPLGAAGIRSLVTLTHALQAQRKKRGCTAVAFGGGGAIAMIIETV